MLRAFPGPILKTEDAQSTRISLVLNMLPIFSWYSKSSTSIFGLAREDGLSDCGTWWGSVYISSCKVFGSSLGSAMGHSSSTVKLTSERSASLGSCWTKGTLAWGMRECGATLRLVQMIFLVCENACSRKWLFSTHCAANASGSLRLCRHCSVQWSINMVNFRHKKFMSKVASELNNYQKIPLGRKVSGFSFRESLGSTANGTFFDFLKQNDSWAQRSQASICVQNERFFHWWESQHWSGEEACSEIFEDCLCLRCRVQRMTGLGYFVEQSSYLSNVFNIAAAVRPNTQKQIYRCLTGEDREIIHGS